MDNLVVLQTEHALNLLRLLVNQLLQVLNRMLQLYSLSLTSLELLVPLVQLSLKVVDVVLHDGQLILSVLQQCTSVVKEVSLEIMVAISSYQLIIQLLDTSLKMVVLLKELSVILLNVLDEAVLGLHLVDILVQAEALVGASHRDLLKYGAHMLDIACCERPTDVVSWMLRVANGSHALTPHCFALIPNGEQGDGDAIEG
jgi:hypothetical protein